MVNASAGSTKEEKRSGYRRPLLCDDGVPIHNNEDILKVNSIKAEKLLSITSPCFSAETLAVSDFPTTQKVKPTILHVGRRSQLTAYEYVSLCLPYSVHPSAATIVDENAQMISIHYWTFRKIGRVVLPHSFTFDSEDNFSSGAFYYQV